MKKLISLFSILLFFAILMPAKAQIHLGVRAGLNLANMSVKNLPSGFDNKMVPSFNLGGFAGMDITKRIGIESGLYLSGKGIKSEFSQNLFIMSVSGFVKVTPLYLEVPVNAVYNLDMKAVKLRFYAGPYLAYGIGGRVNSEFSATGLPVDLSSLGLVNESRNINFGSDSLSDIKPFDFGLNFGIGVQVSKFIFTIQYGMGLVNIAADNTTGYEAKNSVFSFLVGYRIF